MKCIFKQWKKPLQKGMSLLTAFVMAFSLLCFSATTSYASETVLKVGYADCDPIFKDENGDYSGYGVAYLEEVSKYTGWKYEYIPDTWENCMDRLERGEVDLLVMAHNTAERKDRFLFSELPMGHDYPVLYAARDKDMFYQDYKSFDGCRIGVSDETSFEKTLAAYLRELDLDCEVVPFSTDAAAKAAILRGDIEMMVSSVFTPQDGVKIVDRFSVAPGYIVVNLQNEALMDQINSAMQKIRIHTPNLEEVLMRTFYNASTDITNLYLTREEQEYIDSVGPIVIKSFENRHPMGYTNEKGEYQGVLVDYLNRLGAMSGLEFVYEAAEYHTFYENVVPMRDEGFGLLWAGDSVEMMGLEDILCQSNPLFDTALAYIRREGEYVTKYDQHTFVISTDMHHVENLLLETNAESRILYFEAAEDCMGAVLNGDAEMAILGDQVADYWLQKPRYADKLTRVAGSGAYVYGMSLYAPAQHEHLINILNKTLNHISDTQKLYMVDNAALSHSYTYQMDDLLYEYDDAIIVIVCLLLMLLGMGILFSRFKVKVHQSESDKLRSQLQTDELTGTYCRAYFLERAEEMIREASDQMYIVRVNICHFKLINELRGIEKCDRLLHNIGARLNELGQEHGFIASRFTADHFYLCIRKADFERIELVKRLPVPWLKMDIAITYGVYPVDDAIPVSAMCDRADMALSANKQNMLENINYYDDWFRQQLLQEQEIENEMEKALAEGQFCIYIQPKFNVATDQIIGGEALVRWMHPQKGMIPPFAFISVFEKDGFILNLDYYVWEEACRFLAEAKEKGLPRYPLSINVSRLHFYNGDLQSRLTGLIEKYHLEARDLEIEITEGIYAEDPESILIQCGQLQSLGFKIAMDDFGSGFSSLNMLKTLPLDIIKMDLKFLSVDTDAEQAMKGRDILRTQIELAKTIGLDVVVEGLETLEQRNFIREIGSCAAQGYYYAKPMPAADFAELLQSSNMETVSAPMSGVAAQLRRERLRREQLQPMLELISISENLFGYLLPEKEGVLPREFAQKLNCQQRIPDFAEFVANSGTISPGSVSQWRKLINDADQGSRSNAAILEYVSAAGEVKLQWVRFDMVMDYEGNPLIAMFAVSDFDNISTQAESLIASMQTQAELEARRMREAEKLLSIITQHSDRVMCLYDIQNGVSQGWKHDACQNCKPPRLCGMEVERLLESELISLEGKGSLRQMLQDIHSGVASGGIKLQVFSENEDLRWVDIMFTTICDDEGKPETALLSYKNVTKQYEHEMAYLRQFQSLSEAESSLGLMEVDLTDDRIELQDSLFAPIESSAVGCSLVDFAEQMITLKMQEEYWHEARTFFNPGFMLQQHDMGNRLLTRTWPMTFHSGKYGWVRFDVELISDIYTGHIRAYFRLWDVTSIREKQAEIQKRSERDGMTGVYNRTTTEELIREKLCDKDDKGIFVILDMDRLKEINDGYGHSEGDKAITSVAQTLKSHFRSSDIIGRIGGDEFVVYMSGAAKNKEVISGTITELLRKFGTLSVGENEEMGITCSIGCVVEQEDSTYDSLYKQADKALYHVKKSGKNNFAFYTPEMENEAFVYQMDRMFSLDHAKRSETGEVQHLLSALSEYYHLVLACNITENKYHLMQEVKDGIFAQMPTFGKMDTMVKLSMMRMTPEDAERFDNAVSRHALLAAGARGEKHVTIYFDFQDFDGKYYPAECTSILYHNAKGDLCEFALIRWRR